MLEDCCIFFGCEVSMVATSLSVGKNNTVDQLTQAEFALFCSHCSTEVFGCDDSRSVQAPEIWELSTTLLENGFTIFPVGLNNVAKLPVDLVVWMHTLGCVNTVNS